MFVAIVFAHTLGAYTYLVGAQNSKFGAQYFTYKRIHKYLGIMIYLGCKSIVLSGVWPSKSTLLPPFVIY